MGGTYSMSSASSPRFIAATPTSSAVPGSTITTLWIISSPLVKVNATLLPAGTVITSRSYLRPGAVRRSISTSALPFHSAGSSATFLADVATPPLSSGTGLYKHDIVDDIVVIGKGKCHLAASRYSTHIPVVPEAGIGEEFNLHFSAPVPLCRHLCYFFG